jgi:hypothetical protein
VNFLKFYQKEKEVSMMEILREATFLEANVINDELVDLTELTSAIVGEGCSCKEGGVVSCTCCGSSREL